MKVVWLCHFHNTSISNELKLRSNINEFAPWITELIKIFEKQNDIELNVVAPHRGIKRDSHFSKNNINYYFYSIGVPLLNKYTLSFLDRLTNYYNPKRKVKKIINQIHPDIIHLFGAENAYYSSTIFQFKDKFPILVSIQGFLYKTLLAKSYKIQKRIVIENKILTEFKHYGVRTDYMKKEIERFNPTASLHWHIYPIFYPEPLEKFHNKIKEYDCVYFARLSKDKGIEDFIRAIKIVTLIKNDVRILIIGAAEPEYKSLLNKMCTDLAISSNLIWAGFIPTQLLLFELVSKAKISVLPTYYDIIPGTIIESMILKVPVIAYSAGGIPEINKSKEVIKLIEVGNIENLASAILELLDDEDLRSKLSIDAFNRANEMFDRDTIAKDIKKAYNETIANKNIF
jgi:glycosyltransferase involved in cell wall biosynthesis